MKNEFYTYCLLKYKHSPFLDESLNIGVLIYFSESKRFSFKFSKNLSRVKNIYDNVPEKTLREYLRQISDRLKKFQFSQKDFFPLTDTNLKEFLHNNILPIDSGVIQFTSFKTELQNLDEFVIEEILFEQYFIDDIKSPNNKQQEPEIIKHLFKELNNKGFSNKANNNRYRKDWDITTNTGNFNFDFAWKNGVWNLVKPIGFDLKTADGIINKARTNLGEFTDLDGEINREEYKCNLIVGRPTDRRLFSTYDKALNILYKAPNTEIIEESDLPNYSKKVIEAVSGM